MRAGTPCSREAVSRLGSPEAPITLNVRPSKSFCWSLAPEKGLNPTGRGTKSQGALGCGGVLRGPAAALNLSLLVSVLKSPTLITQNHVTAACGTVWNEPKHPCLRVGERKATRRPRRRQEIKWFYLEAAGHVTERHTWYRIKRGLVHYTVQVIKSLQFITESLDFS